MTTATSNATPINVANAVLDAVLTTLGTLRETGDSNEMLALSNTIENSKNYKGHSRTLLLDASAASALRSVIAQSDIPEARTKVVTDKLDVAFPAGTAVEDRPNVDEPQDVVDETQSPEPAATPEASVDEQKQEAHVEQQATVETPPDGVFVPDEGRTPLKAVKMLPDHRVPDISQTGLIASVDKLPDMEKFEIDHAKTGTVRYRSKARKTGAMISIIDLEHLPADKLGVVLSEQAAGAKALVVCELHERAAPMPNVRPGKLYLRSPELFCKDCAFKLSHPEPTPEPAAPKTRGRKPKVEQPVALDASVKVVEPVVDDTPSVVHPSDEKAPEEAWTAFSSDLAAQERATVTWSGDKHYALIYSEGKNVDVYVSAKGVEYRWRIGTDNYDSLEAAKAALAD